MKNKRSVQMVGIIGEYVCENEILRLLNQILQGNRYSIQQHERTLSLYQQHMPTAESTMLKQAVTQP